MNAQCNCEKCQAWQARQDVEQKDRDVQPGSHGWMRPHMPEYGSPAIQELPTGLYLGVFHGRASPEQEMEDWGVQGPVIGPLQYVHCTYMCDVKFAFAGEAAVRKYFGDQGANCEEGNFDIENGLLNVGDGMYYGDWTVFYHTKGQP